MVFLILKSERRCSTRERTNIRNRKTWASEEWGRKRVRTASSPAGDCSVSARDSVSATGTSPRWAAPDRAATGTASAWPSADSAFHRRSLPTRSSAAWTRPRKLRPAPLLRLRLHRPRRCPANWRRNLANRAVSAALLNSDGWRFYPAEITK